MYKIIYTPSGVTTNGDVTLYDSGFTNGFKITDAEEMSELVDTILGSDDSEID